MEMKKRIALYLITAALTFAGCITVNVPLGGGDSEPSFQWQLRWDSPIQLSGMVVTHVDGTIAESSSNRWVSRPGAMLSEMLSRDIQITGHYPAVFRTAASVADILTVEGYVREFGASQVDSTTWMAVLDVDVTLMSNRGSDVLMQKNYRFEKLMPESGFKALAEQMSLLGYLWSEEVMTDLAEVLLPRR